MASPADRVPLSFDELDGRIRRGVELSAGTQGESFDPLRGMYVTDEQAQELAGAGPPAKVDERIELVAVRLGLDPIERSILAACAAPEVSWRYARLYGYLHDDLTRQLASPRLVAALLADRAVAGQDVLARLDEHATLRHVGAIELLDEPRLALADRPLKCADAVAAVLIAGVAPGEPEGDVLIPIPAAAPVLGPVLDELRELMSAGRTLPLVVIGDDAVAVLAWAVQRPVLVGRASLLDAPAGVRALRLRAALAGAVLAFGGLHELPPERRAEVWPALGEGAVVWVDQMHEASVLGQGPVLSVRIPAASAADRGRAWAALAPGAPVDDATVKFRLSSTQIAQAVEIATARARARGDSGPAPADLDYGARAASRHGLEGLASRVEGAAARWDDLVIAEKARRSLAMIPAFVRERDRVLFDWGFARRSGSGFGLTALFAGESGTGKTMAAQVVASELGLELFRIDLATVVSKFIGETEKQLDRIFAAAAGSNAILLFDEADALFGRRSQVQDAHDRYANVEVAYLLQRIEGYDGVVILTTNLLHNIDQAFLRRLDLVVEFPFPEAADRAHLWRQLLPDTAPVDPIDIDFLADRFKLAGGSIRNACLAAAVIAASDSGRITMEHIVQAVALEYDKLGRLTLESDFERFYSSIRGTSVLPD